MRKAIAITSIFALLMGYAVVPAALAADNETMIINSGENVDIETEVEEEVDVEVNNVNTAFITQESVSMNNTGGNVANGNISFPSTCGDMCGLGGGTSINTGNATSNSTMTVDANKNTTAISIPSSGASSGSTSVVNTGEDLDVETETETETEIEVNNMNFATVMQSSSSWNNTGWNMANNNIGETGIHTGAASSNNDMSAHVNANTTAISVGSGTVYPGGSSFADCLDCAPVCDGAGNCTSVINSGEDVDVDTETKTETEVKVNNLNTLMAWQTAVSRNNSGHNVANNNIYGADVTTGTARSNLGMNVEANNNETGVILDSSMPMGTLSFMTLNSGADADLEAEAETETDVDTNNANMLILDQYNCSWSSSGWNISVDNVGGSSTGTGHAGGVIDQDAGGNENTTIVGGIDFLTLLLALIG